VTYIEEPCIVWRKSTASNTGNCVQVAVVDRSLLVRDSMHQDGPVLRLSPAAWSSFLARVPASDVGLRQA
jgi:Domain of unknown function (DUF397)